MWSIVQYKRMGRHVAHEVGQQEDSTREEDAQRHGQQATKLSRDQGDRDVEKSDPSSSTGPGQAISNNEQDRDNNDDKGQRQSANHIYVRLTSEDEDPINPKNWPLLHRSKNMVILSLLIFSQAWAGAAESQAATAASQEFGVSKVAESLSTSMYLFGIGSGALVAGPIENW